MGRKTVHAASCFVFRTYLWSYVLLAPRLSSISFTRPQPISTMCIGITILCLPPSVAISGYFCWYNGEKLVIKNHYQKRHFFADDVPDQTFASYFIGIAALGGAYYLQSLAFPFIEGGTLAARELKEHATTMNHDHFSNSKQFTVYKEGGAGKYSPPKDVFELARRVAPPITLRVFASSMAFFCAGVAQTYVALRQSTKDTLG